MMSRYSQMQNLIKQRKNEIKNFSVPTPKSESNPSFKIEDKPNKNNIDDISEMFGNGLNIDDYKLPEEPKKKGRRKKSEFNGSFNF